MIKNQAKPIAVMLAAVFLIFGQPIKAGQFPSESEAQHNYPGGSVTLSKSAAWTDAARGHAEATLTFGGLSQVIRSEETADILFILDTSDSMGYQGCCINPGHLSATTLKLGTGTYSDYGIVDFNTTLKPLVQAAVLGGTVIIPDAGNGYLLDESILIPVPNPQDAPLYLYPMKTDFNGYTYKTADYTVYAQGTWGLVDFSRSTYVSTVSTNYPWHWYHYRLDGVNNITRLGYPNNGGGNGDYNPFWMFELFPDGTPRWWDMSDHGCMTKARGTYEGLDVFTQDLLAAKPDSRIAFAAFNTYARHDGSAAFLDFTGDAGDVADYLKIYSRAAGQTNYEAGMRSAKEILDNDTGWDNGHKKIIIFVTDGMPNRACIDGDMAQAQNIGNEPAFQQAKAVMDEMKADYPGIVACTASCSIGTANIDRYVKPFLTPDGTHYTVDTYTDEQNTFIGAFNELYSEYILTTKIVTVSDIIDSRYFTVDEAALNTPGYVPGKCTVQVEDTTVDSLSMQRVTFTYKADAEQEETERLRIPLVFVDGAAPLGDPDPGNTDYYPTNYDPGGTGGGASCDYTYLDGTGKTIETPRVWLQRNITYLPVLHDVFNGVDQAENQGVVVLEDWQANNDTDKDIYIENAGTGTIYVRLRLTETLTGGNQNYDIQADPYTGCAPFGVYTPGMDANDPAYTAAFAEDETASHSIIDWALESPVFDLATWDGAATGRFWLMDKMTGWAYWMEALAPGWETDNFLTALSLKEEQDGLSYTIDVEADAVSAAEADDVYQRTKDNHMEPGNNVGDVDNIQRIFNIFHAEATK